MSLANADRELLVDEVYPKQSMYGFALSPDGSVISFVRQTSIEVTEKDCSDGRRRVEATPRGDLYVIAPGGGYPEQVTIAGSVSGPAAWSPSSGELLFTTLEGLQIMNGVGGNCRRLDTMKVYKPSVDPGDLYLGLPTWSPDGTLIAFASRLRTETALFVVAADGASQRKVAAVEGHIIGWNWSPSGRHLLFVTRGLDGTVGDIRTVDLGSNETRVLFEESDYEYQKPAAIWSDAGRSIIFRSNRSGWSKLWLATETGESLRQLTTGDWDERAFRVSPVGAQLVYASTAEQKDVPGDDLWIVSVAGGTPRRLTRHAGLNIPMAWSTDETVFYWHVSPTEPGDLWSVPSTGGEPNRLTRSAPRTSTEKLRSPLVMSVERQDATNIPVLIYQPKDFREGDRYPAIVWIRGGPTMMCRYTHVPFLNWLANTGFVVVTLDYRGSTGHGVHYMSAVCGNGLGQADLEDVLAVARFTRSLPYVIERDSRGLGVGGHSWGGYLALMALAAAPNDFACGVASAAITDWAVQQAETEVRYYDRWLLGGFIYEQPERVVNRSPITHAESISVPLLMLHGEEDRDVPFAQVPPFVEKVTRLQLPITFHSYAAEGHSNERPENQQDWLNRVKAFYCRHLHAWDLSKNPCGDQVQ